MTPGEPVRDYYREQGVVAERERIIKLIRAYEKDVPLPESFDNIIGIEEVIALIEGKK